MKEIFHEATQDEIVAHDRLLNQVETRTRPGIGDPFQRGGSNLNS